MSEIKNHEINIKKSCTLLCITAVLAAISLCFFAAGEDSESTKITSEPSHIVFNRWYDANNVPYNINKEIEKEITYHATLPKQRPVGAKLIFQTRNALLSAYTNGKLLTVKSDNKYNGFGEKYTIIDLEDLGKNKEISVHLTPLTADNSAVCGSIYIAVQNEFLLSLLKKAIFPIAIILLLSILTVYFLMQGIKNIYSFKKYFYTALLMLDILFITFYHSTLPCLLTGSGTFSYMAKYLSAMLFPMMLSLIIKETLRCKSVIFSIYETSVCIYGIIRLIIFTYNPSPLNEYNYINFVLLSVLILITILHEKERSKKVKNNS